MQVIKTYEAIFLLQPNLQGNKFKALQQSLKIILRSKRQITKIFNLAFCLVQLKTGAPIDVVSGLSHVDYNMKYFP